MNAFALRYSNGISAAGTVSCLYRPGNSSPASLSRSLRSGPSPATTNVSAADACDRGNALATFLLAMSALTMRIIGPVAGKAEPLPLRCAGAEALHIDAVRDHAERYRVAVALEIVGIGADEPFATEQPNSASSEYAGQSPFWVMKTWRGRLPPCRPPERPVGERISAGGGDVEIRRTIAREQASDKACFFPRGLVPQRRESRPVLELLSANRGNMDEFVERTGTNIPEPNSVTSWPARASPLAMAINATSAPRSTRCNPESANAILT